MTVDYFNFLNHQTVLHKPEEIMYNEFIITYFISWLWCLVIANKYNVSLRIIPTPRRKFYRAVNCWLQILKMEDLCKTTNLLMV